MKTFVTKKQSVPSASKAQPYVHHPMGPVQNAQLAEIRRILHFTGAQAKLTIGESNDKYEQEADRVADEVMRMPKPKLQRQSEPEEEEETLQTKPLADQITPLVQRQEEPPEEEEEPVQAKFKAGEMIQRMCPECEEETAQRQPMEEEEEELQAKSKPSEAPTVMPSLESRINSLKGGGRPLDPATRAFFEPRFGHDFSHVRVHSDASASESARVVSANAFTVGRSILFGKGKYGPSTTAGKKLLAHELAHVTQQGKGKSAVNIQRQTLPPATSRVRIDGPSRLDLPKRLPRGYFLVLVPKGFAGATYKWKIKAGGKHAKIVAGANSSQIILEGISNGRVTLEVEVGSQTQKHTANISVLVTSPGGVWVRGEKFKMFSGPVYGYRRIINYQLLNHEKRVLTGSGFEITEKMDFQNVVSETPTTISVRMKKGAIGKFPKKNFTFGKELTDSLGKFDDRLRIRNPQPLPNEMYLVIHQTIKADGIAVRKNELVYSKNNVKAKKIR